MEINEAEILCITSLKQAKSLLHKTAVTDAQENGVKGRNFKLVVNGPSTRLLTSFLVACLTLSFPCEQSTQLQSHGKYKLAWK